MTEEVETILFLTSNIFRGEGNYKFYLPIIDWERRFFFVVWGDGRWRPTFFYLATYSGGEQAYNRRLDLTFI